MPPAAERWFAEKTWQSPQWTLPQLLRAKGNRTVSVVLPALDEEDTVAGVITAVRPLVGSLVDELVVMDSGSSDATVRRARAAGARVMLRRDVLPGVASWPGKGGVLWRSLAATTGDFLVFLDSDLVEPASGFVPALLGPLLTGSEIRLVKGFYRRPLRLETEEMGTGGGRVTELLVRPLLAALRPELSGVIQPLGGEYAASRDFLESVPFAAGYGVEIGLLLDAHGAYGLDGLAQVNLGVRKHRNRSLLELGVMARQILGTMLGRCGVPAEQTDRFIQFVQVSGEWLPHRADLLIADHPSMGEVLTCVSGDTATTRTGEKADSPDTGRPVVPPSLP